MNGTIKILLGGTGGQGLGLAGVILAQACAEEEGKNVLETEAYGISMRGGMSRAEVLVSRDEINEIRVTEPDILLAMSQPVADDYIPRTRKDGIIIVDSAFVTDIRHAQSKVFLLSLTEEARKLGMAAAANIVALGAIASLSRILGKESLLNVLRKKFAPQVLGVNLAALEAGYKMGQEAEAVA
jgi:2-oxoglutarate ferredoxin oxidoreductase subunit gamma